MAYNPCCSAFDLCERIIDGIDAWGKQIQDEDREVRAERFYLEVDADPFDGTPEYARIHFCPFCGATL